MKDAAILSSIFDDDDEANSGEEVGSSSEKPGTTRKKSVITRKKLSLSMAIPAATDDPSASGDHNSELS